MMSHPGVILHFQDPQGEMKIEQWGDGPSAALLLQRRTRYRVKVTDSLLETEIVFSCDKTCCMWQIKSESEQ